MRAESHSEKVSGSSTNREWVRARVKSLAQVENIFYAVPAVSSALKLKAESVFHVPKSIIEDYGFVRDTYFS